MITHHSFCEYHLGDNLAHLHFLRAMAKAHPQHSFVHYVHSCHMGQLSDVVRDIPTIEIHSLDTEDGRRVLAGHLIQSHDRDMRPKVALNVWKNHCGFWERHRFRNDYARFYIEFFKHVAEQMGFGMVPVSFTPQGLLFDYPKLLEPAWPGEEFDYLVINSRPCSGQFMAYSHVNYFDPLLRKLIAAGKTVAATQETSVDGVCCTTQANPAALKHPLTITQIGNLSMRCKNIIAVATGPLWPCINVWSNPEKLIICIDCPERNIAPGAIYCTSLEEVEKEISI